MLSPQAVFGDLSSILETCRNVQLAQTRGSFGDRLGEITSSKAPTKHSKPILVLNCYEHGPIFIFLNMSFTFQLMPAFSMVHSSFSRLKMNPPGPASLISCSSRLLISSPPLAGSRSLVMLSHVPMTGSFGGTSMTSKIYIYGKVMQNDATCFCFGWFDQINWRCLVNRKCLIKAG